MSVEREQRGSALIGKVSYATIEHRDTAACGENLSCSNVSLTGEYWTGLVYDVYGWTSNGDSGKAELLPGEARLCSPTNP